MPQELEELEVLEALEEPDVLTALEKVRGEVRLGRPLTCPTRSLLQSVLAP